MVFHGTILVFHRAERRRREARHETYITPKLVTTRRSILGPPAEGRPGPSDDNDDGDCNDDGDDDCTADDVPCIHGVLLQLLTSFVDSTRIKISIMRD